MAGYFGVTKHKKIYLGTTPFKAAYKGAVKLWNASDAVIGVVVTDTANVTHIARSKDYGATWQVLASTTGIMYTYMVHGCNGLLFLQGSGVDRKWKFIYDDSTVIQDCDAPTHGGSVPQSVASTGKHIIVSYHDSTYNYVYISSNGVNFTANTNNVGGAYYTNGYVNASALLNTFYLASGSTGGDTVFTQTNGAGWVQIYDCWRHGSGYAGKRFIKFSRLLNRFITTDNAPGFYLGKPNTNVFSSGFTWTYVSLSQQFDINYVFSIIEGTNKVVAFVRNNANKYFVIYSSDGVSWTEGATFVGACSNTYFDGAYFIAQTYNGIYKSEDGITWIQIPNPVSNTSSMYYMGCSEK